MGSRVSELRSLIDYELFSGAADGRSHKTIELTVSSLNRLIGFLEANGLSTDAAEVGSTEIRGFILDLQTSRRFAGHPYARPQETGLSPHTVNCYLRAIRAAWNRWVAEDLVGGSPFDKVRVPKAPRSLISPFTEEQLAKLMAAINTSTAEGYRDYVLINMYLDTGCRLSEITNLGLSDVDLNARSIKVLGKGRRERVVPIGATVGKLVWKYLRKYRPEPLLPQYDHVFLTRDGRPLTKNRVEAMMKKYGARAGLEGVRCSPHTLRHTACLMWIRNGGDVFSLQHVTGHSSLEVLRGYVNLVESHVRAAHRRYSPVDNLKMGISRQPSPARPAGVGLPSKSAGRGAGYPRR